MRCLGVGRTIYRGWRNCYANGTSAAAALGDKLLSAQTCRRPYYHFGDPAHPAAAVPRGGDQLHDVHGYPLEPADQQAAHE